MLDFADEPCLKARVLVAVIREVDVLHCSVAGPENQQYKLVSNVVKNGKDLRCLVLAHGNLCLFRIVSYFFSYFHTILI